MLVGMGTVFFLSDITRICDPVDVEDCAEVFPPS